MQQSMECCMIAVKDCFILAWQMWSRDVPYSGQHYHAAVYAVVAMGLRPSIPERNSLFPGG